MRSMLFVFAATAFLSGAVARVGPAAAYPPAGIVGDRDPAVTQSTITTTICVDHYTTGVRDVSEADKKFVIKRDGVTVAAEVDHLISLELGGSNNRDKNLWAEPYSSAGVGKYGARVKDVIEKQLSLRVCGRKQPVMTLTDAQSCITVDWIACGRRLGVLK